MENQSFEENNQSTKMVIVICHVTGNQGQEICERFQQLQNRFELRGLTRNKESSKARVLAEKYKGLLTLYSVDYKDPKTMEAAFENVNALYLNGAMSSEELQMYETIVEAALQAKRNGASTLQRIIVCSGAAERQRRDTSWRTEEHIRKLLETTHEHNDIRVLSVRFADLDVFHQ